MEEVKDDEAYDLCEEDPLSAQHFDARHVFIQFAAHREALFQEQIGKLIETLVAPHGAGEHIFSLQDEIVLAAADFTEIQKLQSVDEDVAEIMELEMRGGVKRENEENEKTEMVAAIVGNVWRIRENKGHYSTD